MYRRFEKKQFISVRCLKIFDFFLEIIPVCYTLILFRLNAFKLWINIDGITRNNELNKCQYAGYQNTRPYRVLWFELLIYALGIFSIRSSLR